jgi:diguanylate cyclase (GGDEF)-like protein
LATWGFSELESREGTAGGSDLFVVHARRDNAMMRLRPYDEVKAGEVVAEFIPPANQSQLAIKDFQQAQAQVRKEAIRVKPLSIDQGLVQREAQLRSQITQEEGFLLELQRSRREVEKDHSVLRTEWTREKSQLEAEIASVEKLQRAAASQLDITRAAMQQASDAFKKQIITQPVYDERRSALISAELEENKQQVALSSLTSRLRSLEERYNASDAASRQQLAQIDESLARISRSVEANKRQLASTERLLVEDRTRAKAVIERETEAAELEAAIAAAEKERSIDITQIKAPFGGHVVFRHPAPELAAEGSPVLAISAATGFIARIRLPQAEADQLVSLGDPLPLALEHPALHNIIPGRFVRVEPLLLENSQVIALFECTLPPEVVAGLGTSAEPVRVRLLWKPSLLMNREFQASCALAALGVVGLMFSGYRGQQGTTLGQAVDRGTRGALDDDSSAVPAASSMETADQTYVTQRAAEVVDLRSRKLLEPRQNLPGTTDALTGLINRSHFLIVAEAEVQTARQSGTQLSVVLIRVDQLRQINTAYSRKIGDSVVHELADLCRGSRERDISARWSGEDFVVLLPDTDRAGAQIVAHRLSWGAEQVRFGSAPDLRAALKVGVAELFPDETSIVPALLRAEKELEAKEDGTLSRTG